MDLSTTYMGLKLKNPLVASASPLSEDLDNFKRLEDAGVAAIVKHSLFEEQLTQDVYDLNHYTTQGTESFPESLTYFPDPPQFVLGPDEYLEHIYKAKRAVTIPIIGSLNGHSAGGWTKYAKYMEEAGANAIELNIYFLATDPEATSMHIENVYLEILHSVKSTVKIPVAVKLSPFFTSLAHMAKRLDELGADALVLFNRFYQPDIDLDKLEVVPNLILSTPFAMRLPLRWIAILYGRIKASLAATSGIHNAEDVLKMVMVGADVTMLCSTLLKNGIGHIKSILNDVQRWMDEHDYESIQQMKGSMSYKAYENPKAFERANYMKVLQSFH
jgi:dihydroorotate dehydrogenase (fumarate)